MKTIHDYMPPDAAALRRLQERLGYGDAQMAELAGLDDAVPWSSYIGGPQPRALGQHRLLAIAARLALDDPAWQAVLAAMREIGARFDYDIARAPLATPTPAPPPAQESKFGMQLVSDHGAFHEMEQLREFAHHAQAFGVTDLVRVARYDSGADLCRFTLAPAREQDAARRDRVFDAASRTITRFVFDGRIYRGGIPPESDG